MSGDDSTIDKCGGRGRRHFRRSCPYFIDIQVDMVTAVCDAISGMTPTRVKTLMLEKQKPCSLWKNVKNNHGTKQLPSGLDVLVYSDCGTLRADDDGSCC